MSDKKKAISKEDVEYLGNLAKLSLTEKDKELFKEEFERILYYVSQLSEVPTDGAPPSWHVLPVTNVLRQDVVSGQADSEEILGNAPERTDVFFKVPKIIP